MIFQYFPLFLSVGLYTLAAMTQQNQVSLFSLLNCLFSRRYLHSVYGILLYSTFQTFRNVVAPDTKYKFMKFRNWNSFVC